MEQDTRRENGRKGGLARAAKLTPAQRQAIAHNAVQHRWHQNPALKAKRIREITQQFSEILKLVHNGSFYLARFRDMAAAVEAYADSLEDERSF